MAVERPDGFSVSEILVYMTAPYGHGRRCPRLDYIVIGWGWSMVGSGG